MTIAHTYIHIYKLVIKGALQQVSIVHTCDGNCKKPIKNKTSILQPFYLGTDTSSGPRECLYKISWQPIQ